MSGGWIKLYRSILDNAIWTTSSPEQKVILITILCLANHEEKQWQWKGKKFTCKPGQFITSLPSLSKASGCSVQNIRTALKKFEEYEFLTDESTRNGRLITIVNWDKYQGKPEEPTGNLTDAQQVINTAKSESNGNLTGKLADNLTDTNNPVDMDSSGLQGYDFINQQSKQHSNQQTPNRPITDSLTPNKNTKNDKNDKEVIYLFAPTEKKHESSESNRSKPRDPFTSLKQEQLFDEFWKAYPKKKSKGQAEKTWIKLNPDEQLVAQMVATIERAKKSRDWQKDMGQYVPYPSTWLNAKGWEDEYEEPVQREEDTENDWGWQKET